MEKNVKAIPVFPLDKNEKISEISITTKGIDKFKIPFNKTPPEKNKKT